MGLRKFDLFNQAMLAKQGWNILTTPDSLLAPLYKALYFPTTSYLQAETGSRPSPYWRDLLWGRSLLTKGLGWKVGDGTQIDIKNDNWLMGHTYFKLYHPHTVPPHLNKVADLIDWQSSSWNNSILQQYFTHIDAERISKILLPPYPIADKFAWLPTHDGQFSVLRAYWFGYHLQQLSQAPSSSSISQQNITYWKNLWSPYSLPKINIWARQASYQLPIISINGG